jgi:hypothetical protein
MAKIEMRSPEWTFTLSGRETAIVLAALGGRLRDDQADFAKDLGDRLTLMREEFADDFAAAMSKHASKVEPRE